MSPSRLSTNISKIAGKWQSKILSMAVGQHGMGGNYTSFLFAYKIKRMTSHYSLKNSRGVSRVWTALHVVGWPSL